MSEPPTHLIRSTGFCDNYSCLCRHGGVGLLSLHPWQLRNFARHSRKKITVNVVLAVGKAGGEEWKSISASEKTPYETRAAKKKTDYEKLMMAYNKKQNLILVANKLVISNIPNNALLFFGCRDSWDTGDTGRCNDNDGSSSITHKIVIRPPLLKLIIVHQLKVVIYLQNQYLLPIWLSKIYVRANICTGAESPCCIKNGVNTSNDYTSTQTPVLPLGLASASGIIEVAS
ncbi:High mobility group (HMG) box domain-containing protein [Artemisia annua]|uniref:High mobility group (HMG) box domain-containing protein n=1 Tax=Artemisia annua TaxID=35608 RepID=A0A2U1NXV8_ARTAN|nr:High mobility group (HMG) box domain-containing protein [Artemisia annua]